MWNFALQDSEAAKAATHSTSQVGGRWTQGRSTLMEMLLVTVCIIQRESLYWTWSCCAMTWWWTLSVCLTLTSCACTVRKIAAVFWVWVCLNAATKCTCEYDYSHYHKWVTGCALDVMLVGGHHTVCDQVDSELQVVHWMSCWLGVITSILLFVTR